LIQLRHYNTNDTVQNDASFYFLRAHHGNKTEIINKHCCFWHAHRYDKSLSIVVYISCVYCNIPMNQTETMAPYENW